ncbi:MAG: hypothetical protein ABSE92_09405 [Terriglobales bacterium]
MFEMTESEITRLRVEILDAMMDDAEDVEQIYRSLNRTVLEYPNEPKHPLRAIIDELKYTFEEGLVKADYTNNESVAPLATVKFDLFHHYWFSPPEKGKNALENWHMQ